MKNIKKFILLAGFFFIIYFTLSMLFINDLTPIKNGPLKTYDNMLNKFSDGEIIVIIYHELGYNKNYNNYYNLIMSIIYVIISLYILILILEFKNLNKAFGAKKNNIFIYQEHI